jgi:hypothetical protein
MHQAREILRQRLALANTYREAAQAAGVSVGAVSAVVSRALDAGLDWESIEALDDEQLEARLYGSQARRVVRRPLPDPAQLHIELRRVGVTLQLLHLEYLERHPDGYQYTRFCDVYREWLARRSPTMRQVHVAGDKMFVDYSGKKPRIVDPETGELIEVEFFVAIEPPLGGRRSWGPAGSIAAPRRPLDGTTERRLRSRRAVQAAARSAFTIARSLFTMPRDRCSRCREIGVHDGATHARHRASSPSAWTSSVWAMGSTSHTCRTPCSA